MRERSDIGDRGDILRLVTTFYGRAFEDELLGPVFVDVAQLDLESHLPRIADFWDTVLLGARSYGGGAFAPHVRLHHQVPLTRDHFDRWLGIWTSTVDELFSGEVADAAKRHATRVATAFHARLEQPDADPRITWVPPPSAG